MAEDEKMSCPFCKGTGQIKKKFQMTESCPRCSGTVILDEHVINDELKVYNFWCIDCGTLLGSGVTDSSHDLTKAAVLYRGLKEKPKTIRASLTGAVKTNG